MYQTGWINSPVDVHNVLTTLPFPLFASAAPGLVGTGEGKTTLLYKSWKDVNGSYIPYKAQVIGECFPAGTMVLGERTKPIESVEIGDKIWTGEGKLTTVISKRAIYVSRPMVEISPVGGIPVTCTADHEWLVYRFSRVGGKRITPNYYSRAVNEGKGFDRSDVITQYEGRQPEWVSAGNLDDTDCILTPTTFDHIPIPGSPGGLTLSEEGRFALGYFLGNGHASGGSAEITLPSTSIHTERLMSAFQSHGFNPKFNEYTNANAVRIRVHSVELVSWLRDVFYTDKIKSFPGWMIGDLSFIGGLCAADGNRSDGIERLDSTSLSILYGAYASLVSLGFDPTINKCVRSKGTKDNAKDLYRLAWRYKKYHQWIWRDEKFLCRPVRSTRFIEDPMVVHDVGVQDRHHSFLPNGYSAHNCVSFGFGHGVDLLECVEISLKSESESFKETCTEAIYGVARVDVGGQRGSYEDGAVGAWGAKAISAYGTISREVVGPHSGNRAKDWGANGVPTNIKLLLPQHKTRTVSLVTTYSQLEDALANGYPVAVCSNQGFTMTRNSSGFCKPEGNWAHCMLIGGTRTDIPGALIIQSWGENVPNGPLVYDQPNYSFWADRDVVERMLAANDSWAMASFDGYPRQVLPDRWTYAGFA